MDIKKQVVEQLEQFTVSGSKRGEAVVQNGVEPGFVVAALSETDEGVGASINLADYDRYSVMLHHLEVFNKKTTVNAAKTESYLQQSAEAIAEALTFLEEPLELLELDPVERVAQLRSNPPLSNANESEVTYWEAFLHANPHPVVKLARYHWSAETGERQVVAYPATFSTLGRIAEALAVSLTQKSTSIKA